MLGFLAIRAPGQALDDLAAYVSVVLHPGELLAARRPRRAAATADPAVAEGLLAPRWLPYRHALDAVSDLATALTQSASDVAERRRAAAAERDPSSFAARRTAERERLEDEEEVEDTGLVARFLTNPVAVLLSVTVLAMLGGARSAIGHVSGPGLSPVLSNASFANVLASNRSPLIATKSDLAQFFWYRLKLNYILKTIS